ncbi:hypothetical protein [Thermodesulfovibrio sp.]|jgi:hypothetical protein|uniref:hypothetical protein n=1 Tax=Thermodesulfovibrio TaxID=28261 RepID=UPI0026332A42|nr:hypothetical protein [Thermodesulfovibrio sp.]
MNQKEPLQERSKVRSLLIQAEIALKENRFEEALAVISSISTDEIKELGIEEMQAIGSLLGYLRDLAEEKKLNLAEQLRIIQAGKNYVE